MGYDIYIGNAEISKDDTSYDFRVNRIQLPDAPTFPNDEMTGKSTIPVLFLASLSGISATQIKSLSTSMIRCLRV